MASVILGAVAVIVLLALAVHELISWGVLAARATDGRRAPRDDASGGDGS